jgi:hypothetical protein
MTTLAGFYYLHENGNLIYKPHATYEDMDSSFVKHFWTTMEFGGTPERFVNSLKEAQQLGAKESEIIRLMEFNKIDEWIPDAYAQLGLEK